MIPVEYLWLALIAVFGLIGMVRGLWKELGVTTILLLSLFTLKFTWKMIGAKLGGSLPGNFPAATVQALYYIIPITFITFIAYEGFTLRFPGPEMKGIAKSILGVPAGLVNGYLFIGTVWDVTSQAKYFGLEVPLGSTGTVIEISDYLTKMHNTLAQYLPVTFVNEYIMLAIGMLLLLAIILK